MATSFPFDAEIAAEIAQYPTRSLSDALDEMVTSYLCFEGEDGADEEKYRYRKSAYYQSYYPYIHPAPWWKRLGWRLKKVDHPHFPEKTSFAEAARFFIWMGRQRLHIKLLNGEAKAFGYALPRNPKDLPVPVPPDVWGEDMSASGIDWKKSAIKENELAFCAVQIVFAEDYELANDNSKETNEPLTTTTPITSIVPQPRRKGRRTLGPQINQAIILLHEKGILKPELSQLSQVAAIRDQVKIILNDFNRDNTDLGEDAILNRLREFLKNINADKSADK
jgi:hypothetical protein